MKFEALAAIAKLAVVTDVRNLGYPVSFDLLATNHELGRTILLGARQQVSSQYADQLYRTPYGIYAPVKLDTRPVSLLFVGYDVAEVQDVLSRFQSNYAAAASSSGRMPASEVAGSGGDGIGSDSPPKPGYTAWTFSYAMAESFAKCGLGVVQGFNAITIDPVVSAGKSLYNLATNTRWWISASKQQMLDLYATIKNFDVFARKQYREWDAQSPQEKSRYYCSFLGGAFGTKTLVKGTEQLAAKLPAAADAVAEGVNKAAIAAKLKSPVTPKYLLYDAKNIVEPSPMYIGKRWWVSPAGGAEQYPYLASRDGLEYLKSMANKPPESLTREIAKQTDAGHVASKLRDYPTGATERIERALASPDVNIDGQSFVVVNGARSTAAPRLMTEADMKTASPVRRNPIRDTRVFTDDGSYSSIRTPSLEYQGNGRIGYGEGPQNIQNAPVRVLYGDRMIEGQYLSSGGPGVPRGADIGQLTGGFESQVKVHFIKVGDQTIMVPAEGAEIFARTR